MKKSNAIIAIITVVAAIAAIATLVIIFREQLEVFLSEMRDKYIAVKQDILTPDEYSDYADVD